MLTLLCVAVAIVLVIGGAVLYAVAARSALSTASEWEDEDQ